MKLNFDKMKTAAMKQLEGEWQELQETVKAQDAQGFADAILKLRELPGDARFTLQTILCGEPGSALRDFKLILNDEEWMRLPAALDNIISEICYCILDDGRLRLMRTEILDDIDSRVTFEHKGSFNRLETRFWLSTDYWTEDADLAVIRHKSEGRGSYIRPRLTSVKSNYFENVQRFVDFIELLADPESWDSYDFIGGEKLDKLMKFGDEKEMLEKPVDLKSKDVV